MSSPQQRLLETMGRAAPSYGRVGPDFFTEIADALIARAPPASSSRALDVGTGPGTLLARLAATDVRLVGIDLSAAMVDEARNRLGARAEILLMDAERLAFADQSFDTVFCTSALYQLPNPERALREFHRVLRTSGTVAVAVFAETDRRWRGKDELISRRVDVPRVGRTLDADDLEALLHDADFEDVRIDLEFLDVAFCDAEDWLASAWTHGERRALEALGTDAAAEFQAALPAAIEPAREADGALHWRPQIAFAVARKPAPTL